MMEPVRMGVVADDITGANDIGSMFAKHGYRTYVYSLKETDSGAGNPLRGDEAAAGRSGYYFRRHQKEPDVLILDTNSRFDSPDVARRKVHAATLTLMNEGFTRFFNKTCSVFRGNIGAEFDAMLDALKLDFALVVLGFPKNGRITCNGIHYVHGIPLGASPFSKDPMHPMRESNLLSILMSQTKRRVALLPFTDIARGPEAVREAIERERRKGGYLIADVVNQEALGSIAAAAGSEPLICGSSALAEVLPAVWGPPRFGRTASSDSWQCDSWEKPDLSDRTCDRQKIERAVLCAAGSLTPQTKRQIERLSACGAAGFKLATRDIFNSETREALIAELTEAAIQKLRAGEDVLIFSANSEVEVTAAKRKGAELGYSSDEVSRLVSGTLAEIVGITAEAAGVRRFVLAGGDTSAAICRRLLIDGLVIDREIQTGLPACISMTDPKLHLVLKSGSFGSDDFLLQAVECIRAVQLQDPAGAELF